MWLVGGGPVWQFLEADVVDEMMLFDIPVFLGSGIRLFQEARPPSAFALKTISSYKTGVVLRHYVRQTDSKI